MDTLRQDLVHALRRLAKAPAFTLVAVATLALGIGANSAIYSVVSAVLLRPLPYPEPERLARLAQTWKGRFTEVYSPQNFLDLEAQARNFASMAAVDGGGITLTGRGAPLQVQGAGVSARFFQVLGVEPVLGRSFRAEENEPGRTKVAVLSDALWRRRFGADPNVLGQPVHLDRETYEIVGVAPSGFAFPEGAELWTPLVYDERFRTKSRGAWYLGVIARLGPGVSLDQASREVAAIGERLAHDHPEANEGVGGALLPLQESLVGETRTPLLVLFAAVGLVLLVACVNVANLQLARTKAREAELAVRSALGAGRGRLLRQLVTESLVLAALGGVAGLLLASIATDALLALRPEDVPRLGEVRVDYGVTAFAALLSLGAGLFFGVVPALHVIRAGSVQALHEGSRTLLGARGRRLRSGLVVGQLAMALVLLSGAGLLGRSFLGLRRVDPGFRTDRALTFRLSLPDNAYPSEARRSAFFEDLLARLSALPGVREVGAVAGLPLGGTRFSISFTVEGRPPLPPSQQPTLEIRVATAGYLQAMGIPVRRGRGFEPRDRAGAPPVVLLSEAAALQFFSGEEVLGQRLTIGMGREAGQPPPGGEVVGIVGDVKDRGLARPAPAVAYLAHPQLGTSNLDLVLRTAVPPRSLVSAVERAVHGLDPELPLNRLRTLDEVVGRSVSEPRFYALLLGAFAGVALLLAAIGLFGVMTYAVAERRREIGIRVALGAHPREVRGLVLRQALALVAAGIAIGLLGALALGRTLASLLFELQPHDPLTLGGVASVLAVVALVASDLPARRATRVDPLVALRAD